MGQNGAAGTEVAVRKTTELSLSERAGILELFNSVFGKNRTMGHFQNQFFNTVLGYSYHALLLDGEKTAGCYSFTPSYYRMEGARRLCTLGLDLFIAREYRGHGFFQKMFSACLDYMRNDGIEFIITFPNDISYPGFVKTKLVHDFGCLTIYALPYRIGAMKRQLKILNWLSVSVAHLSVFLSSVFASGKVHSFPIEKDAETYNRIRYTVPGEEHCAYHIEQNKAGGFVYKIMDYDGIRTAFLIDVFVKSAKNFATAVKHIIKYHKNDFDIVLYVGRLPFRFHGLIAVSKQFSPKNFHFLGQLLKEDVNGAGLFCDPDNWDINLSNYDLL